MKIKPRNNYTIKSKSEFIFNIVRDHILKINKNDGVYQGKTLFGKYITDSDTPIKNGYIISRVEIEGVDVIELEKRGQVIEVIAEILGNTEKAYIQICKEKLKDKPLDSIYYYMTIINESAIKNGNIDENRVKYITSEYKYSGVHSQKDKYAALIKCIQNPEPNFIYETFRCFNENNGGYQAMCTAVSNLVYEENLPNYVMEAFKDTIMNPDFNNRLLHFTTSMITSNTPEELALKLITNKGKL